MNKMRGRPRTGTDDGRDRLLTAARNLFATCGYHGATLRMIAQEAHCDPALIAYHFGSKKELFARAMALSLGPSLVLEKALDGDPTTAPERLAALVIRAWDAPEVRGSLAQLVATGMQHPEVLHAFREYLEREIVSRLGEYFGGRGASERASATITIIIGIIFGRYVIGVEPLRSLPPDRLVDLLTPSLRAISTARPRGRSVSPSGPHGLPPRN
ncbi:TetR/AcrR family transcriptional regulator [Ruania halotolerans]|uniref:TetR/AcrR family transcriptional regulator n=1 Tax=Ruania halotolerans TaxID=2897773 RepID=UPI001E4D448A|nr:TetR family transcriptional regulator [Ruania halotolerans]UFU04880.1 TetR family transcriptional regulator [Ruania halotolerans]